MLAAAILYIMYIIHTVHTSTYTQHKGIGIYPLIMGCPTTIKSHTPDPSQGQGVKWLVSNTTAQERVKRGSVLQLPCSLAWRQDRNAQVLGGREVSL